MSAPSEDPAQLVQTLPPGGRLGDYQLGRVLDVRGMFAVYEARHLGSQAGVALKVLRPSQSGPRAQLAQRLLQAARSSASLDHPHIARVLQVASADGTSYVVTELLQGVHLGRYLQERGKLTVQEAADLLLPVARALAYAHERGIAHYDLKPQNIVLCGSPGQLAPKLCNFGVSRLSAQPGTISRLQGLLDTPFYFSPEQAMESADTDARSDQFSLAAILYECVSGKRAFFADSLFDVLTAIVHMRPAPLSFFDESVAPAFEALVERALSKQPQQRFASMSALAQLLESIASGGVQSAATASLSTAARAGGGQPSVARRAAGGAASSWHAAQSSMQVERSRQELVEASELAESGWHAARTSMPVERSHHRQRPRAPAPGRRGGPRRLLWVGAGLGALLVALVTTMRFLAQAPVVAAPAPPPAPPASTGPTLLASHATPSASSADTASDDWETPSAPATSAPGSAPAAGFKAQPPKPEAAHFSAAIQVEPADATLLLDGVFAGVGRASFRLPVDGRRHRLEVLARGYEKAVVYFTDAAPPTKLVLAEKPRRRAARAARPRSRALSPFQ